MAHHRSRMDLDQRKEPGQLRDQPGDKKHVMLIKPVGKPMPYERMDTLV
jgi:hypothetical protein